MKHEIVNTKAGLTNTEGVISSWALAEGTKVKKGDVIGDIENEKSTIPLTSPADGFLKGLLETGGEYKVGATIGYVVDSMDEAVGAATAAAPQAAAAPAAQAVPQVVAAAPAVATAPTAPAGRKRISPYARKLAEGNGVDYHQLTGTGPGGSVVAADVLKAMEQQASAPTQSQPTAPAAVSADAEFTETAATAMRKSIARNLTQSLQNTAQASASAELDATNLLRFKDTLKDMEESLGNKITINEVLSYMVVKLAMKHPCLNTVLTDAGMLRAYKHVSLSFALANVKGLITPVVRNADQLSLNGFSKEMKRLVALGRDNALDLSDLQGGTITISNLGMYPVDGFTPIVNPPQAAIFGFGRAVAKPVYVEGELQKRDMMHISLAFDHRSMDGADVGEVFRSLKAFVEQPQLLLLY